MWRQGSGGYLADLVGLEADHAQLGALAQALRQFGKGVVRTEQHAQVRQAVQVVGQAAQGVAGEVEDFQRVGQFEDFPGELGQPAGQVQARNASQLASLELGEGIHAGRSARKEA